MANSNAKITLALLSTALTSFWARTKAYIDTAISNVSGGLFAGDKIATDKLPLATATDKGIASFGNGLTVAAGTVSVDFSVATTYTDNKVAELIGGAPETYDTLKEISDYISTHGEAAAVLTEAIGNKANAADVYTKEAADTKFMLATDVATNAEVVAAVEAIFNS